jgi:N6-adenosine-specific RNA methylase IME4
MRPVSSFSLIAADPPWPFDDKLPGKTRGAEKNYPVMSLVDINNYLAQSRIYPREDALLLLWRVSSMQEEALAVARCWGFTPKSELVWIKGTPEKLHFGMGRYVRAAHETCLVAARGRAAALVADHSIRSVFFAPTGLHSQKPDAFYEIAERLFPGPRIELFARKLRPGWHQRGRQLGKVA